MTIARQHKGNFQSLPHCVSIEKEDNTLRHAKVSQAWIEVTASPTELEPELELDRSSYR